MNKEWIIRTLINQGLTHTDAQIYSLLTMDGPRDRKEIAQILNLSRYEISRSLSHLKNIGIISEIPKHPAMFSAISFDNVLAMFFEKQRDKIKNLQDNRNKLISSWNSFVRDNKVKNN